MPALKKKFKKMQPRDRVIVCCPKGEDYKAIVENRVGSHVLVSWVDNDTWNPLDKTRFQPEWFPISKVKRYKLSHKSPANDSEMRERSFYASCEDESDASSSNESDANSGYESDTSSEDESDTGDESDTSSGDESENDVETTTFPKRQKTTATSQEERNDTIFHCKQVSPILFSALVRQNGNPKYNWIFKLVCSDKPLWHDSFRAFRHYMKHERPVLYERWRAVATDSME